MRRREEWICLSLSTRFFSLVMAPPQSPADKGTTKRAEALDKIIARFKRSLDQAQNLDEWYGRLLAFIASCTKADWVIVEIVSPMGGVWRVRSWHRRGSLASEPCVKSGFEIVHGHWAASHLDDLWRYSWSCRNSKAFSVPVEVWRKSNLYKHVYHNLSLDHLMILCDRTSFGYGASLRFSCGRSRIRNPLMNTDLAEAHRQNGEPEWLDDRGQFSERECAVLEKIYKELVLEIDNFGLGQPASDKKEIYPIFVDGDCAPRFVSAEYKALIEFFYGPVWYGWDSNKDKNIYRFPEPFKEAIREKRKECANDFLFSKDRPVRKEIFRNKLGRVLKTQCIFHFDRDFTILLLDEDFGRLQRLDRIASECAKKPPAFGLKQLMTCLLLEEQATDTLETGRRLGQEDSVTLGFKYKQIFSAASALLKRVDAPNREETDFYDSKINELRRSPDLILQLYDKREQWCLKWFLDERNRSGMAAFIEQQFKMLKKKGLPKGRNHTI